ncbi:MAG: DUF5020 family protein [Opitutales bacterium]|nr:DUF5020 family protein [Opitutales bacterium]
MLYHSQLSFLFIFLSTVNGLFADSLNVQQHYDFGEDREYWTTTIEGLEFDSYGSTYAFVDIDANSSDLIYGEVARYFNIPNQENLKWTAQYNGGRIYGDTMPHVGLFGISYKGLDVLYVLNEDTGSEVQLTYVWFKRWGNLELCGYVDIWTIDLDRVALCTEPQLWYWLNDYLAVGGELEISRNFVFESHGLSNSWEFNPTLAVKISTEW